MRKLIAAGLMAAGLSSGALAADLPMRTAPPPPPPLPFFTWTGAYFGVNAGYAFDYHSRFRTFNNTASEAGVGPAPFFRPFQAGVDSDGFTAGGQVGYNYQFGAGNGVVVGIEADAAYTDLGQTTNFVNTGRLSQLHSDMDFLGTVRGRLGYAFDRFLVYGTGGFAYGDVSTRTNFYTGALTTTPLAYTGSFSQIATGYTYGGGVEFAIPTESFLNSLNFFKSSGVTIKAEYLHYDLGTQGVAVNATGLAGFTGSYTQRVRTDGDLARVGINYKF